MATMHPWKTGALKSMRKELGGVNMVDTGMIKELEKLCVPNNIGFLSQVQLQVVESERTHAGRMNKVIDYLVEMEDKYFENFCTLLEENNFKGKAKMLREKAEDLKRDFGGHEDVKAVERSPPEAWHSNAMVVGANVGPETDEHEYKSFMVPTDKTKKPPPMRPCKDDSEVLKKVVDHSKEINAMLNHRTGGSIHFGIHDDGIVEEGLDLPQAALIDKLQTRVGQLLQVFYPAVQSRFVAIQPVNLVNRSGEPTGQWRFDICVTPYDKVVLFSRHQTVAYYRQGGNSEPMPADMMERLRVERQQK